MHLDAAPETQVLARAIARDHDASVTASLPDWVGINSVVAHAIEEMGVARLARAIIACASPSAAELAHHVLVLNPDMTEAEVLALTAALDPRHAYLTMLWVPSLTVAARRAVLLRIDEHYAHSLLPDVPLDDHERPILTSKLRHTKASSILLAMHDQLTPAELDALAQVADDDFLLLILLHVKTFTPATRAALVTRCVANAGVIGHGLVLSGIPDLMPEQRLTLIRDLPPQHAEDLLGRSLLTWSNEERALLESLADQLPKKIPSPFDGIDWDSMAKFLKS